MLGLDETLAKCQTFKRSLCRNLTHTTLDFLCIAVISLIYFKKFGKSTLKKKVAFKS